MPEAGRRSSERAIHKRFALSTAKERKEGEVERVYQERERVAVEIGQGCRERAKSNP